eukprot:CAMPEP_0174248368 /NCGR_PEP_ID=MMETSP0417-20130205/43042_1 /TAXON_ID=242541 /ORGANISM="Mayorella sp, Strain BSH-02190019" /LENGTH=690 /DNA_ID=CAMNT_0015328231 /DNA_START=46 /DNA_END=2114 /DNA_ORIENTATION=-
MTAMPAQEQPLRSDPEFIQLAHNARILLDTGIAAILGWELHSGASLLVSQLEAHSVHMLPPRPANRRWPLAPAWRSPPTRVLLLCSESPSEALLSVVRQSLELSSPSLSSASASASRLPLHVYASTHHLLESLEVRLQDSRTLDVHSMPTPPQLHLWPFAHYAHLSRRAFLLPGVHRAVHSALSPSPSPSRALPSLLSHLVPSLALPPTSSSFPTTVLPTRPTSTATTDVARLLDRPKTSTHADEDLSSHADSDMYTAYPEELLEEVATQTAHSLARYLRAQAQSAEAWAVGSLAERVARKLRSSLALYASAEQQQREQWPLLSVVLLDRSAALLGASRVSTESSLDALLLSSSLSCSSGATGATGASGPTGASGSLGSSFSSTVSLVPREPVVTWNLNTSPASQAFAEATTSLAEHTAQVHRAVLESADKAKNSSGIGDSSSSSSSSTASSSLRRARQSQTTQLRQAISAISEQQRLLYPECDVLATHVDCILRAYTYQKDPCFQECLRLEKMLKKAPIKWSLFWSSFVDALDLFGATQNHLFVRLYVQSRCLGGTPSSQAQQLLVDVYGDVVVQQWDVAIVKALESHSVETPSIEELLDNLFADEGPDMRGLIHVDPSIRGRGLGLLSRGFSSIGLGTARTKSPCSNEDVLVFVLGGLTADELKSFQENAVGKWRSKIHGHLWIGSTL